MSFEVVLKINRSEKNKVTKSLETVATVAGTLKEGCSLIDPVILIDGQLGSYGSVNYITIPSFGGRSYFVNDMTSYRSTLIQISCHCDVLSSFWDEIKTNKAIIKRQANRYNLLLNDGSIHAYQNPHVLVLPFSGSFSRSEESIILLVAGTVGTGTALEIIVQPRNQQVDTGDYGTLVTFTCQATGTGVQYQWQVYTTASQTWSDLTGETASSLVMQYTAVSVTNDYRCLVTDSYGQSVISNQAHMVEGVG